MTVAPHGLSPSTARRVGHVAATVFVVLAGALPTHPEGQITYPVGALVLNLVAAAILLARNRWPLVALPAVVALVVLSVPLGLFNPGMTAAAAIATYSATLHSPRSRGATLTVAVAAVMAATAVMAGDTIPQHVLLVLLGGAIGDAIRTQREYVATITERAERAERTREALARQRVAEDRLAIARDLHDVVAHQIAVINLHAGAASAALRTRPSDAEEALAVIRASSRTVLTEIGDLLATLRDPEAVDTGPPGLSQLDDVVRAFAAHGLDVTVRTEHDAFLLPAATDVTALRVIQEALTNAHKHGTGRRAHVLLEYHPQSLRITVANPTWPTAPGDGIGTGNGLTGMRERVESVRGTLTHGHDGLGTWILVADLPVAPTALPGSSSPEATS
ncbi:sensor histidine kinase [Cellulosimicrobium cellulans]|uniref:sensor histidine kinase n=1 Tax=Cellulosimicrobium cellulans TaxID=1710 RepID=UPI0035DC531C